MSITVPEAEVPAGLPDPAVLARLAGEFFGGFSQSLPQSSASLPAAPPPVGVQAPVQWAPPGSPLATSTGLGINVPGSPVPLGAGPGANLLPQSPAFLPSLIHRAPALVPHATAGNHAPDRAWSETPAYEPRLGGVVQGVPQPVASANAVTPSAATPISVSPVIEALPSTAALPASSHVVTPSTPKAGAAAASPSGVPEWDIYTLPSSTPQYYFADAVTLPSGHVTPAMPGPHPGQPQHEQLNAKPGPQRSEDRGPGLPGIHQQADFDIHAVRRDFPILSERVNGKPLIWLDNAATTHKPRQVIERLAYFYEHENSNIHRAAHALAARATDAYEGARETVRRFINAPDVNEVIFVRGTTEAINLVAKSWGHQHVGEGDEIIVSHLEHHANIVPWQQLAAAKGAKLRVIPVDDDGQVKLDEYAKLLNERTRIVSVTQVSNALGTVTPVQQIAALAKAVGAKVLIDGAQSISHMAVDVQALGADFFVFSGHKVFGPTGIGVLWGRREVLEDMPPWQGGGNMIADVTFERTVYQPIPNKFEAGTGNIADAVGLGAALDYVQRIGMGNIAAYEHALLEYGMKELGSIPGVRLIGTAREKASVLSFVLQGHTTEEVGKALNAEGIAVRTGHHCAQPILRRFGVEATVRPSLAFYNTFDEVDCLTTVVRRLAARR